MTNADETKWHISPNVCLLFGIPLNVKLICSSLPGKIIQGVPKKRIHNVHSITF